MMSPENSPSRWREYRNRIKRLPFVGSILHGAYLKLFRGDGRVGTILEGRLAGMKLRQYNRTIHDRHLSGMYEPEMQRSIAENLREGDVFWDVGANAGFMTLLGAKLVGPSGVVVAFEPSKATARQLRAQVRLNGLTNVRLVEAAVCNHEGTVELTDDTSSDMLAIAEVRATPPARTKRVRATTLDAMLAHHPRPDLVKIDIEGAELLALRGATRLLREIRPTLLVEIHSEALYPECSGLMSAAGYAIKPLFEAPAGACDYHRFVVASPLSSVASR